MAQALPDNSDFSDEEDLTPLDLNFNQASDHVRKLTSKLDNNQLLELYGLFKQSTEGECHTPKPGWLDGKGRRKWEAWRSFGDISKEEAKQKYIDLVKKHDPKCEIIAQTGIKVGKESWAAVSSLQYENEPDLIQNDMSLLDAARENMAELVTNLLTKNPMLREERDEDGLSPLHWAADRDAVSALSAAIKGGCDVNAVDSFGQTALHYAASCGHLKSTKILIDSGASNIEDNEGCTPLDVASDDEVKRILESAK